MAKYSVKKMAGVSLAIMLGDEKILDLSDDSLVNGKQVDHVVEALNSVHSMVAAIVDIQNKLYVDMTFMDPHISLGNIFRKAERAIGNAHAICLNDSVEGVCLGDEEEAKGEMEKLKLKHKVTWQGDSSVEYEKACFWHIQTVDIKER